MNFKQAGLSPLEFIISENSPNWHQWTRKQTRKLPWLTRQGTRSTHSSWGPCALQGHLSLYQSQILVQKNKHNAQSFLLSQLLSTLRGVCVSVGVYGVCPWPTLQRLTPGLRLCLQHVHSVWRSQVFLNWVVVSRYVALFDPELLYRASISGL